MGSDLPDADAKAAAREADCLLRERFGEPEKLVPRDPLDTLILTILSQNTSDHNRDLAYREFKRCFPDWEGAAGASPEEIAAAIRSGGLAEQKARSILAILDWVKRSAGDYSLDWIGGLSEEEAISKLTSLKGVGIKTAAVLLCFAFGRDIFPVDVHVHRICRRLGLVSANASAEKTHHLMQPLVSAGRARSFHLNLLKLGRSLCRPSNPGCADCPLLKICPAGRA